MCATCADSWGVYFKSEPLASNADRHSLLLRCADCGQLFRFYPEERHPPEPISLELAKSEFPSWTNE